MSNLEHDFQTPQPNKADISKHLYALFPPKFVHKFPGALIEIAYGFPPDRAQLFSAFDLGAVADFALARNLEGNNVYVGVALRKPGTNPAKRAGNSDVLASAFAYTDFDAAGALDRANQVVMDGGPKPAFMVMTGTVPHLRAHLYFELAAEVTDGETLRRANVALRDLLGGDDVQNPGRILRLAGTVSYPNADKQKRGYVVEHVNFKSFPGAELLDLETLTPAPQSSARPEPATDVLGFPVRSAYAHAALRGEHAALASARPGDRRNGQLNRSSYSLGQLVGAGALSAGEVRQTMVAAATANGHVAKHGMQRTLRTISSGLNAGIAKPRVIPREVEVGSVIDEAESFDH